VSFVSWRFFLRSSFLVLHPPFFVVFVSSWFKSVPPDPPIDVDAEQVAAQRFERGEKGIE
jgi:hypothetical protein